MTASDTPRDWPELMGRLRADPGMTADGFGYYMRELKDKTPASIGFGGDLMRAAEVLNRGLIMGQGAAMGRIVTLLQDRSQDVADADDADMRARPASSQAILACALVADLGGFGDWAELRRVAFDRLWSRAPDGDRSDVTTAWASLAWGHADEVTAHLGLGERAPSGGPPKIPDAAQRRIAQVMQSGGPLEDAQPAWQVWRDNFPKAVHDDRATWNDFLWAARAVYVVIGNVAPTDLPGQLVRELAAL
ncbi:hypothetical protein ACOXXX_01790 [Thalassococcus sp. BH17M4-6]|uniref:hypothetical protein n=1 Tax=Thalassococcus sp. BH17M4-6 TaxID=3413148 RepID=UPI003BDE3260